VVLALPKAKAYSGAPNYVYGVFTAADMVAALNNAEQGAAVDGNNSAGGGSSSSSSSAASAARPPSKADALRHCAPAVPAAAADAERGGVYFVCDVRVVTDVTSAL
jgi:hypothetical protein